MRAWNEVIKYRQSRRKGSSYQNWQRRWEHSVRLLGSRMVANQQRSRPAVMRIAQIAPLAESVPPKLYGGTERVVAWLVDELVSLGHEVTLFASGDSRTRGKLHPVWPRALRLGRPAADPAAASAALLEAIARRAAEFDVIHSHIDWLALPLL